MGKIPIHAEPIHCNLILSKTHEELRVENKDYESLEINSSGDVCSANSGKELKKKKTMAPVIIAGFVVIIITVSGYLIKTERLPTINTAQSQDTVRIETQIIIMQSGQTYYADTVEEDGVYLKITHKNGSISKVLKSNVLQISKAVIEE